MNHKCLICNGKVSSRNQRVRNGEFFEISYCQICDFEFFSHNPNEGLEKDQLDHSRLASAGLNIPDIEEDFINGTLQSKEYFDLYINDDDVGNNVLEIGCSWGYFLNLIKDFGCNAYGAEINQSRMNYVNNNLHISCKSNIDQFERDNIKFKKIFLFYVLEYIQNPVDYVSRLLNLLNQSGELIIITPNLRDILKDVFKNSAFSNFFYDKFAINYFSKKSLIILSNKLDKDFKNYEIETRQGYSYANHINWFLNNKPTETKIVGGDNFIPNLISNLKENKNKISAELIDFYDRTNKKYKEIITKSDQGNQIILKFKK